MSYKWSQEEQAFLAALYLDGHNSETIAEAFATKFKSKTQNFYPRTVEAIEKKMRTLEQTQTDFGRLQESPADVFKKIFQLQSEFKKDHEVRTVGLPSDANVKILSMSDIHFPFAREDLLNYILENHSDADICVLNGDLFEGYAFSTFAKSKRVSGLLEYRCVFDFVKLCSETFSQVVLVDGNHDIRVSRYLSDNKLEREVTQILRPNLMARIANGEELDPYGTLIKKWDFDNVTYQTSESWYVKIGKTIFAHPHGKGSAEPGFSVKKTMNFFANRYRSDEVDSIVIGHTHKIYKGVVNSKLLIEQGCLADAMDYAFSPKMDFGAENGMNGFAIIYQDEYGNTDFNKSGPIFLGEVLPPKKDIGI